MEAPEVQYAKSGDVNIACSVVGDGPFDLVFVSGWVLSVLESAWDGPAADTLSRLASFSRLILFDKRGTGLSDRTTGIPDLETRMESIRAVMDAVGLNRLPRIHAVEGDNTTGRLAGDTFISLASDRPGRKGLTSSPPRRLPSVSTAAAGRGNVEEGYDEQVGGGD